MAKTQKEAVYVATRSVLSDNGIVFEDKQDIKDVMTTDMRKSIISIVVEGLKSGEVALKEGYDMSKVEGYTNGMVSNWFRKDKRFNGGTKHVVLNPGSRAGSTNPQIKEMRKLLKTVEPGSAAARQVETVLAAAIIEHKAASQKQVKIDVDALPAELRDLVKE